MHESATLHSGSTPEAIRFEHPYAGFLKKVAKPARYIGGEKGQKLKNWDSVESRFCLAFPDLYDIGMSHLGYRILYKILNDRPNILAERCYTPWVDMQKEIVSHGELLRSLENARPLCDFDIVGFSLQYELTYTNVLTMLQLGGIPLRAENRTEQDPLIVAGGPVATHAEPIAPFMDAFVIGDAEDLITELTDSWAKTRGQPRQERLLELSKLEGIYIPSLYDTKIDENSGLEVVCSKPKPLAPLPVDRRLLEDLSRFPFPDDVPVGGPEAIFDRVSIEVARGCTEGCRFCQAGMIYRPVRERKPEEVVETVINSLKKTGHDEVSLTALSTADVSCISPLIRKLTEETAPERVGLSVASLRAYGLADDLLDEMRKVRTGGLTFAPEAGTQRMRDVINKNVTEEQLLETAHRVFSKGFDVMKLYFIIGLPTEQDEDIIGIANVARNALAVAKRLKRHRARITVSVSSHVPKPHTPFQWCAMDSKLEIRRKQNLLRAELVNDKGLNLRCHDSSTSNLEGVFARGGRKLADVLEHAFLAGARFDSWEDQLRMDIWDAAFNAHNVEPQSFLGTLPLSSTLPWDHFDIGLEQGFLAKEYQKALRNRLSPPCGKAAGTFIHHTNVEEATADQRRLVCYDCGIACDMSKMRSDRVRHLEVMGALQPSVAPRSLPIVVSPHQHHHDPESIRPVRISERQEKFRLSFEKLGPSALLGHLDFMREIGRVFRRAGLRIAYSQGYKPKPRMTFSPALGLGVYSLNEKLEIDLLDAPEISQFLPTLNLSSGAGLRFFDAEKIETGVPTLGAVVAGARYILVFANSTLDEASLEEKIQGFLNREKVVIKRVTKGIGRIINVRERVDALRLGDSDALSAVRRAGIVGRVSVAVADVSLTAAGSLKPVEIVEALLGDEHFPHQTIRECLLLRDPPPKTKTPDPVQSENPTVLELSAP